MSRLSLSGMSEGDSHQRGVAAYVMLTVCCKSRLHARWAGCTNSLQSCVQSLQIRAEESICLLRGLLAAGSGRAEAKAQPVHALPHR